MKRLGVLGTLVWDRIWTLADQARGRPREDWGGIAYSLAGAAAACPPGWEIVPLLKVGADLQAEADVLLGSLPALVVGPGLRTVPEPNNRVELRYTDAARRGERLSGGVPPWTWDELRPQLGGLDALYVNFVSGWEMELDAAERLRAAFPGPTWADLHSLFLGCPGPEARPLRRPPEWARWAACFDAVQMNADELATLGVARDQWPDAALPLLRAGAGAVFVTRGAGGAAAAFRSELSTTPAEWPAHRGEGQEEPGAVTASEYPLAGAGAVAGDPTGCGDVWGVTLFAGLLGGRALPDAVAGAHAAATRKLGVRGASALFAQLRRSG